MTFYVIKNLSAASLHPDQKGTLQKLLQFKQLSSNDADNDDSSQLSPRESSSPKNRAKYYNITVELKLMDGSFLLLPTESTPPKLGE